MRAEMGSLGRGSFRTLHRSVGRHGRHTFGEAPSLRHQCGLVNGWTEHQLERICISTGQRLLSPGALCYCFYSVLALLGNGLISGACLAKLIAEAHVHMNQPKIG